MNRNRENIVKRLVDRKMTSSTRGERGCVPCLGMMMKRVQATPPSQSNNTSN